MRFLSWPSGAAVAACLLLLFTFMGSLKSQAQQADAPETVDISAPEVKAHLEKVENYFKALTTMEGRFIQANPDGSFLEGDMFMHRPGRMRFEYDEPVPILLVADGDFFIFVDKELKEATHIPLSSTPANLLLSSDLSLQDDQLTLTGIEQRNGLLRLQLHQTAEPDIGSLVLTFAENPFELKQWTVVDAQQNATTVTLIAPTFGHEIDPEKFRFRDTWKWQREKNRQ